MFAWAILYIRSKLFFMNNLFYPLVFLVFSIISCQTQAGDSTTKTSAAEETEQITQFDYKNELGNEDITGPMTINGVFKNKNTLRNRYVRLYETEGKDIFVIDSAQVIEGKFTLNPKEVHVGLHRIGIFPDERQLGEVILNPNEKEITLTFNTSNFKVGMSASDSKENEGWIKYMAVRKVHKAFVKENRNSGLERPVKLKRLYDAEAELKVTEDQMAQEYVGTYFSKMVRRFQSANRWDKDGYWDDIDFKDPSLIRSRVFSDRIMDYMRVHAKKENTDKDPTLGYYNAVDVIAQTIKEGENDKVLEFMLYTMSEGMYSSGHEDVSLYVVENYFYGDACGDSEISELFKKKAAGVRNLQVGNKPPNFIVPGHDGKSVELQKIIDKSEYTLVLFWASYCHKCVEEIPELKKLYTAYHDNGFDVVGVSVDLQKNAWLKAVKENEFEWYNCADIKGWKGETAKAYRVSKTPAMFLVNKNGTLIMRPKSAHQLKAFLDKKFN
ncbi:MAG: peroxiredoxin [Patiriisocius sp.]|jgi:peroxiredoxin